MSKSFPGYITLSLATLSLLASSAWYTSYLTLPKHSEVALPKKEIIENPQTLHTGHYVLVNLNQMRLELHEGTSTLRTLYLVSQGKPGSYYETIGGSYSNDYKEPLHFSSIGHVYLPFSVHIFGNFFIHGIPYYPDGTKVSSTYSGGCLRLADNDARTVYDFISPGTKIIITNGGEYDFEPTATTTATMESLDMTRLMVATISLEFLTQDNKIIDTDGINITTRRDLLPRLLQGDQTVAKLYAKAFTKKDFLKDMNDKAQALGLTNTIFTDVQKPVITTKEDLARFMNHIDTYKSYLLTDTKN